MIRLLALIIALGMLIGSDARMNKVFADDEKKTDKKDDKKKDDKKDEKKDDKKKDDKKDEKKKDDKKDDKADAQKQELEKLTGTFTITTFERDGKKSSADELKKMKVVQKGATWSFHLGDEITQGKDTIFPEKSPKEINSTYTTGTPDVIGKTVYGIYKIDGDTITYCWAEIGKPRPTEFATKEKSNLTLMVLKRVKEEKKEEKKKDEKKEEKKKEEKKKDDKKEEKK